MCKAKIMVLINFKYKVNVINSAYKAKLGLKIYKIDISDKKIDGSL